MAKARRRPVKNPSIPRLEWVAKTYPAWVWWYTAVGWMEAAGMDDVAETLVYEIDELSSADPEVVQHRLERLMNVLGRYAVDHDAENTEYDKYIPWLAKSVNSLGKSESKKLRRILEKEYPGLIYMDATFTVTPLSMQGGMGNPILMAIDAMGPGEASNAAMSIDVANEALAELQLGFGTVVRWAIDKDINLDGYDPLEAVELAKEWARTRPKDEAIVGGDVVYEFDDGWTFQELKTRPQLKCEGDYLDHCVKGYRPAKIGVVYRIYSLRNPDGEPVATMEWKVDGEYVSQYKGMSNQRTERDVLERGIEFRANYIDGNLTERRRLEEVPQGDWPKYADQWKGEFLGMYRVPGRPNTDFAVYDGYHGARPERGVVAGRFLQYPRIWDEDELTHLEFSSRLSEPENANALARIRNLQALDIEHGNAVAGIANQPHWIIWRDTGAVVPRLGSKDEMIRYIESDPDGYHEALVGVADNPRKRRKDKRKKTPEWKRLLNRSQKLWETYDAKPLKKHLLAFGKHIEKMKASSSLKVKTEARSAARAFNAELKARGWKR